MKIMLIGKKFELLPSSCATVALHYQFTWILEGSSPVSSFASEKCVHSPEHVRAMKTNMPVSGPGLRNCLVKHVSTFKLVAFVESLRGIFPLT
jgi:hypothetical protein